MAVSRDGVRLSKKEPLAVVYWMINLSTVTEVLAPIVTLP